MARGTIYQRPRVTAKPNEAVITSTCGHNCGGRCVVNAHVRRRPHRQDQHRSAQVDPRDAAAARVRARLRPGRAGEPPRPAALSAAPDRAARRRTVRAHLLGRGAGRGRAPDAPRPRYLRHGGHPRLLAHRQPVDAARPRVAAQRLLHMFGGCTELWSNISAEAEVFAVRMTYGAKADYKSAGREPTDYVNSRLIIMWGWSPGDGTFGTGTLQYLKLAKKHGMRIICVDPRQTRTSHELADEHVFIRPSTDAAALIAMAYVIVSEGLHDQAFLDRHVLGLRRGAPAAGCAGRRLLPLVPARARRRRAQDAGVGRGHHRHAGRDDPSAGHRVRHDEAGRAAVRLRARAHDPRRAVPPRGLRALRDHRQRGHRRAATPASATAPPAAAASGACRPGRTRANARVATPLLADLLARGKAGGYPADIKMIYSVGWRSVQPGPNVTKMRGAADGVEFMVVHDHFMTPTARYADIVLPATTFWERNDVHTPWAGAGHYAIFMQQAIAPMYECRNDIDICADLAGRLGLAGYNDKSETAVAARADQGHDRRLRHLRANRASRASRAGGRRRLRARDPRPRAAPVHDAVGEDRDLLDGARRQPRPYGLGAIPPIPTWIPPSRASDGIRSACHAEVARAHALDPRQPADPRAGRSATTSG